MDAIERAYEVAAEYTSATITIHMFKGTHYLLRYRDDYYMPLLIDKKS
jgi:hypothetical protein